MTELPGVQEIPLELQTRFNVNADSSAKAVVHPRRTFSSPGHFRELIRCVTQRQHVTHGKDVSLRGVLNRSHAPVGTYQTERAPLFALLQEGPPELINPRPEAGFREVVNSASDDFVSWKPEQLARTATGVPIVAVIVRDEDGLGSLGDNRPEQQFKLF
jgi:hypothetical protein